MASVGTTSTLLVVSDDQPFERLAHASVPYRRVEELRRAGMSIEIVTEEELRARLPLDDRLGP